MDDSSGTTGGTSGAPRKERLAPLTKAYIVAVSSVLCFTNLMLPAENGLPPLRVLTVPLLLPMVVAFVLTAVLALRWPLRFIRGLLMPYTLGQCILIGVLFAASFLQGSKPLSVFYAAGMFATFVLNYILVVDILKRGGREIFVKTICAIAGCAALVGIWEFVTGSKLTVYAALDALYWISRNMESGPRGSTYDLRVTGTLGNSIVYATAMMLVLPFVTDLRSTLHRRLLLTLVLVAAFSTLSRTAMLFGGVFAVGYLMIEKARAVRRSVLVLLVVAVAVLVAGTALVSDNQMLSRWGMRFSEEQELGQSGGLTMRLEMMRYVISASVTHGDIFSFVFGRGLLTTRDLGREFSQVLETVDNAYTTLLYEHGLLGILAYGAFYGWLMLRVARTASRSYHWWSVAALLISGMSFVTYQFQTINFVAVASIAMMTTTRDKARVSSES